MMNTENIPSTDGDEDYEQTETSIDQPKQKFPDDDSNIGDQPLYPDESEIIPTNEIDGDRNPDEDDDEDDETTISIGN